MNLSLPNPHSNKHCFRLSDKEENTTQFFFWNLSNGYFLGPYAFSIPMRARSLSLSAEILKRSPFGCRPIITFPTFFLFRHFFSSLFLPEQKKERRQETRIKSKTSKNPFTTQHRRDGFEARLDPLISCCNSPFDPFISFSNTRWSQPRNPSPVLLILTMFCHLIWSSFFAGETLLEMKEALNDTRNVLRSWNGSDATPCNWTGITCHLHDHRVRSMYATNPISLYFPFGSVCKEHFLRKMKMGFEYFFFSRVYSFVLIFSGFWLLWVESIVPKFFEKIRPRPKRLKTVLWSLS